MITAKEARKISLSNPSFERKTELYKAVSERIDKAAAAGEKSFEVNEEEHLALEKELTDKGYSLYPTEQKGAFYVTIQIVNKLGTSRKYYF